MAALDLNVGRTDAVNRDEDILVHDVTAVKMMGAERNEIRVWYHCPARDWYPAKEMLTEDSLHLRCFTLHLQGYYCRARSFSHFRLRTLHNHIK